MVQRKIILLALMLQYSAFSFAGDNPSNYRADARSIYLNDKIIFSLPSDEIDGSFAGPISLADNVIFIERRRNLLLRFSGEKIISKKVMWPSVRWRDFPKRISHSTFAIIRINQGIIIYDADGKARLLDKGFKLKRLRRLDVTDMASGVPYQDLYDTIHSGSLRLYASVKARDDHYFVIDTDSLEMVGKGLPSDKGQAK